VATALLDRVKCDMRTEPIPQVLAFPCSVCGEEAIVRMRVVVQEGSGVRLLADVVKQCGCRQARGDEWRSAPEVR
jgi:predicted RNA-binding Zn-ribbon protein involved in translation (DUF1610 family)